MLGLAVCAGGCNVGKPAPAPSPSASYTACANNLEAFVKRTELAQQLFIQQRGVGSASGSSSGQMHTNKSLSCDLRGKSEDVDQFMKNLRTEFQRTVQQQGGQLDEPIEDKTIGDPLGSFELSYAAGTAHGKVEVSVSEQPPDGARPGMTRYQLSVKIRELAPTSSPLWNPLGR